ncbi:MAG: hypothetical protein V3U84_00990, partial [Thiotrichaceae bacterium]
KPAPIQITYLGYPNTTGTDTMDYRLTDKHADPEGVTDQWYTEKLIRLPHAFLCYAPPQEAPHVNAAPCLESQETWFGSFNNLAKVTSEVIRLWSKVLSAVPDSRLLLKNNSLADESTREKIYKQFAQNGVKREHIELLGQTPSLLEHLRTYHRVDIALDTYPYNGTTTTFEALWMGIPVITRFSELHAGRVGYSIMKQLGLSELTAETDDDFIRITQSLANNRSRIAQLRTSLRERLNNSTLCNAAGFTHDIESVYRQLWNQKHSNTG